MGPLSASKLCIFGRCAVEHVKIIRQKDTNSSPVDSIAFVRVCNTVEFSH